MPRKRTVLLAVAALLCAAALYAIGVLVLGHFGGTQARIIGTMALLAGFSLLAYPAVVLVGQRRGTWLAAANAALAGVGAAAATVALWSQGDDAGRIALTAAVLAAAVAQAAALYSRRSTGEPPVVDRLYAGSVATAAALATMLVAEVWGHFDSVPLGRAIGAVAVLDALLVALQPVLARLRPAEERFRLLLTLDDTAPVLVEVSAPDLGSAAAKAIRDAERRGGHVRRLELER